MFIGIMIMILVQIMVLMLALMRMLTLTVIRNIQVLRTVTLVLILILTPTLISMPVLSWDRVARALTISAYDSSFCSRLNNAATLTAQFNDAISAWLAS